MGVAVDGRGTRSDSSWDDQADLEMARDGRRSERFSPRRSSVNMSSCKHSYSTEPVAHIYLDKIAPGP